VATQPKRFVFVVESNGFTPQQGAPEGYKRKARDQRPLGGPSELVDLSLADKTLPMALLPLTPWKDKVTIVQGLSGKICGVAIPTTFKRWAVSAKGVAVAKARRSWEKRSTAR
jgi:hypothetical protein